MIEQRGVAHVADIHLNRKAFVICEDECVSVTVSKIGIHRMEALGRVEMLFKVSKFALAGRLGLPKAPLRQAQRAVEALRRAKANWQELRRLTRIRNSWRGD